MSIGVAGNAFAQAFTTAATTHTTTGVTTQATGSTFVIGIGGGGNAGTINVPTDSRGNTYTQIQAQVNSSVSGARLAWFYSENGAGGASHTFTSTSSGSDVRSVFFAELTGGLTSGILDQSVAGIEDTSSPYSSNTTGTTSQANEMALAFAGTDSVSGTEVITWGGGFSSLASAADANFVTGGIAKQLLSSAQTVTSSMTSSGAGSTGAVSFVATFKEAASPQASKGKTATPGPGVSPSKRFQFEPRQMSQDILSMSASVALTGQSISIAQGTVAPAVDAPLSGQSVLSAQGSLSAPIIATQGKGYSPGPGISPNYLPMFSPRRLSMMPTAGSISLALSGQQISSVQGSLALTIAAGLAGQAVSSSIGIEVPATSIAITGASATVSSGSIAPQISIALTGNQALIGQGNVSSGSDVIAALTGQSITSQAGILAVAHSQALTGSSESTAQGSLSSAAEKAITGQGISSAQGSLTPSSGLVIQLSGIAITTAQGSMIIGLSNSISGQMITSDSGWLVTDNSLPASTKTAELRPLSNIADLWQ